MPRRQRHPLDRREALLGLPSVGRTQYLLRFGLRTTVLHGRACRSTFGFAVWRHCNDCADHHIHDPGGNRRWGRCHSVGGRCNHLPVPGHLRLRMAGMRLAVLFRGAVDG